jgi:hypothetical protein
MMQTFLLLIWLLSLTVTIADAAIIRLAEDGGGRYRLEGEALSDVAALDLALEYDPALLTVTSVTQGSLLQGMLFVSNLNQPGLIRIGVVGTQSVNGSGDLALISVDVKTDYPQFTSLNARLNNAKGGSIAVSTLLTAPEEKQDVPEPEETNIPFSRIAGGVTGLPSESAESSSRHSSSDQEGNFSASSTRSNSGPRMIFVELREFAASSPVKLMAAYRGVRGFKEMEGLFLRNDKTIRQHPYPALSDGQAEVEIILPALHAGLPSLALSNAKLLWSGVNDNGEWAIRCLPVEGAHTAKILVLGLDQLVEIPVVVAPAIDLNRYPLSSGEKLPRYDLDQDGEHTWVDDYILMANLLHTNLEK